MPSDSAAASEFGAGSPSASTPDFSSLSGVPEEEYEKILKAYKDRLEDEATRAPNRNRLLMARRQTKDFKPGYTIRFLPNACHIELVPSKGLDFDGDSFGLEMPVWEPVIGPTKKVGIATDMQTPTLKTTNRHTITIQMAGMDVYLRPKVKNPFYDLTVGGITVNKTCVRFDDMYEDELAHRLNGAGADEIKGRPVPNPNGGIQGEDDEMAHSTSGLGAPVGRKALD